MNLKHVSDKELLANIQRLAVQEREILTSVLHHLREIERRRLFSSLGYSSLYTYAIENLGYSEDQAYRRISAMRLLRDLPQVEHKIQSGGLNLTNLSLAQSLFRKQEKLHSANNEEPTFSDEQKIHILEKLENKSSRDAEKIVMSYSSEPVKMLKEKMRAVGPDVIEVKFTITAQLQEKFERLKGLIAHSNPDIGLSQLLDKLCDLGIQKWDPALKKSRKKKSAYPDIQNEPQSTGENNSVAQETDGPKTDSTSPAAPRVIGAEVKREVWIKAKSQCEQCGSKYALQIDHRIPRAMSGGNEIENLRLLCRSCNQRAAIQWFGIKKMEPHLSL